LKNIIKVSTYSLKDARKLELESSLIDIDNIGSKSIICQTIYTAISPGTEIAAFLGLSPLRPGNIYPRLMGYCNIAIVIYTDVDVSKVSKGDILLTFQSHRSHFVLGENDFYIKIDPKSNLKKIVTAYLYHLGLHAGLTAKLTPGNSVAIIGGGVLGYTSAIMSKVNLAEPCLFSNQAMVIEKCLKSGIDAYKKPDKPSYDILNNFDVVINTSNTWEDWKLALILAKDSGTIVNLGFPGRGESLPNFNPLDPQYIYVKSLSILALKKMSDEDNINLNSSYINRKINLIHIVELINSGVINADEIISDEINFLDLENQYYKYINRQKSIFSTIVKW
jgi:threonine dehydrogenase-like Zn-dependent dehydrogenase